MLFNRPIQDLLPQMNTASINMDNNNVQYDALEAHQSIHNKSNDTQKTLPSFLTGSIVAVQWKDGGQ